MSNIRLPNSLQNARVDTFTRTEGGETVHMQAFVRVDPSNGRALSVGELITTTNVSANNTDLFSIESGSYTYVTVQLTGTWVGTVSFQASNDGTNWVSCSALNSVVATYVTTATANALFYIPVGSRYVRARTTAYTSGTIVASAFGATDVAPIAPQTYSSVTLAASTALVGDFGMGARATTTNASLRQKVMSEASTNATSVKASAGRVYGYLFSNTTASYKYVKLFNKASAPTVGTDVPVETIAIPPNNTASLFNEIGVFYSLGIAYSITGAAADADATAVAANDVIGSLVYA